MNNKNQKVVFWKPTRLDKPMARFFKKKKNVRVGMKKILAQISLIKYYKLCDNNFKNLDGIDKSLQL